MPSHPFLPASRVGKYEIVAHVATGGMGAVYKAVDTSLGRTVALKVLANRLVDNPGALERFRREARHAASLNHPNIVTLYEWGQIDDSHYLAMEFVDGPDLDAYILARGRLGVEEAHAILVQSVQALDHAYRQGVVHRDIKPSNFLLARQDGELLVKLTDLGLARNLSDDDFRLTRDGSTVGTVDYLSPEQARDSSLADTRSDIYSLGCTAYHMLAGQPPFPDGGLGERVYKHLHTEPPELRSLNPAVPPNLAAVLKRMLAKTPGARYQTPASLLHDLLHLPGVATEAPDATAAPPASPRRRAERQATTILSEPAERTDSDMLEDDPDAGVATPEQRRAAAGQYERACEVLAVGDSDYARHLLMSCCNLDPTNLRYRQALRQSRRGPGRLVSRWMAPLSALAGKARLKVAQRKGDHLKVLERGEEVLARAGGRGNAPEHGQGGRGARPAAAGSLADGTGPGAKTAPRRRPPRLGPPPRTTRSLRSRPQGVGAGPTGGPRRPGGAAEDERPRGPGDDRARQLPQSRQSLGSSRQAVVGRLIPFSQRHSRFPWRAL